jgi:ATP/maltotriose-dependent transcriptional regulator MalT/two-component SAPR family response regulator
LISPRAVTKIVQPSRSRLLLPRPRLIDFLRRYIDRKLILVSAAVGSGKTSLLIEFAHATDLPMCWYSLDETDADPRVFLEYLIAAVNRRFPQVGEDAQQILNRCDGECDLDAVVGALVTEIHENIADSFLIVLDDYHLVAESEPINHLVDTFLRYLPEKAHVLVSSRTLPSKLALLQLEARQQFAGLGSEELKFTADEIRALVLQNYQVELSAQDAADLAERSEGWIAGILLTTPHLWEGLGKWLLQRDAVNDHVFHFLAKETFVHLDGEIQRFLLDCSVPFRMDGCFCDELFHRQNSGELLRKLEDQNLFIVRLNDEGGVPYYRFHNLYREFLCQRLEETDPTRWRDLNRRAAELYEKRDGFKGQAIAHYLSVAMYDDAARAAESIAQSAFDSGHWTTLARWVDALPPDVLATHPNLTMMRGMVFATFGKNTEAEATFARAIEIYDQLGDPAAAAKVAIRRAVFWRQIGRYHEAIQACERALETLRQSDSRRDEARAYQTIGAVYALLGECPRCVTQLEKALSIYEGLGDEARVAGLHHDIGTSLQYHGDPAAGPHFQRALDYWQRTHNRVGLTTTLISIGIEHHRAGHFAPAIETLEEARTRAQQTGNRRDEAFALASLGDVRRDQCRPDRALELYHQVLELGEHLNGFILTYALIALGEVYGLWGDEDKAKDYLARALRVAQAHQSNYELGLAETAIGISEYRRKQPRGAIARLNRAVGLLKTMRRDQVRARLHLAQAHLLLRQTRQVQCQLRAIMKQNPSKEASTIPFVSADRKQLRAVIRYTASFKLSRAYFASVLEMYKRREGQRSQRTKSARRCLQVTAFGPSSFQLSNRSTVRAHSPKTKELFFLFLTYREGLRREQIVEFLWAETSARKAINNFHTAKMRLRRAIPGCVVHRDGLYQLAPQVEIDSDVAQFETLLQSARNATLDGDRLQLYEEAIALYRGDYFEECYSDWCEEARAPLRKMYLDALVAAARIRERQGDVGAAIALCEKFLAKDRYEEDIYRTMMRLQAKKGNRAGAVRTYQQLVEMLQKELEIPEPSQETKDLYALITRCDTSPSSDR